MKKALIFLFVIVLWVGLFATAKTQQEVLTTATNWIEVQTKTTCTVTNFTTLNDSNNTPIVYKIDFSPNGFVVMSADDRAYPILGYADTGSITNYDIPALNETLLGYRDEIVAIITANCNNKVTSGVWKKVNERSREYRDQVTLTMEPTWGQSGIYNVYCPRFNNQRSVVGCVATAMSQITNYHKVWNYQFLTDNFYTSTQGGYTANIFADAATYNFPNRTTLNTYMSTVANKYLSNTALNSNDKAAISFANGVLLHMNYSPSASGASTITDGSRAYGDINYHYTAVSKSSFTSAQWESMIITDINEGHPIHYRGSGTSGGHSFVLNGYNNDTATNFFHFNWGWDSSADGWFALTNLNPNGYNFTQSQQMLYQIYPYAVFNQTVALGGASFSGLAQMVLVNSQGVQQTYNSSNTGVFHISNIIPGTYDMIIKHNSGNYEWYQRYGVTFHKGLNSATNGTLTLPNNSDKIIIVPNNYTDLQDAINRIQDNGTVYLVSGNYTVSGINWSYKHIRLRGAGSPIVTNSERIPAINLTWSGINNTDYIQGITFTNCYISGGPDCHGPAISLMNGASPSVWSCNFTYNMIDSEYSMEFPSGNGVGGAVFVQGLVSQNTNPLFTGCNFEYNCAISTNGGGAVALYGRAQFDACNFTGNFTDAYVGLGYPPSQNAGGAVIAYTQANSGDIFFNTCHFTDNMGATEANDIYIANCDNMNQIRLEYCSFSGTNSNQQPCIKFLPNAGVTASQNATVVMLNNTFDSFQTGAVYFNDYFGQIAFDFSRNIVKNNLLTGYGFNLVYHGGMPADQNYFTFNNNTLRNIIGKGLILYEGAHYKVKNCIFDNCSQNGISWHGGVSPHYTLSLNVKNCFFDTAHQNSYVDYAGDTTYHLYTNELQFASNPNLDDNFVPIWNRTLKSVCVDNGTRDFDDDGATWYVDADDRDDDGSQLDIGARYTNHVHSVHRLMSNEIKYISFPGVVNYLNHETENTFEYVFNTFRGNNLLVNGTNRVLTNIQWKYNNDKGTFSPEMSMPSHHVCSQNGYKVRLRTDIPTFEKDIEYAGNYPGTLLNSGMYFSSLNRYTTEHYIIAPVSQDTVNCKMDPDTGVIYRISYLGYYLDGSLLPSDALVSIMPKLIAIIGEDWAMNRVPVANYQYQQGDTPMDAYTDQWEGTSNIPINPGDMVEVHYIGTNAFEFRLGGDNPNPPFIQSVQRKHTMHFDYEEEMDYQPVLIDLENYGENNKPTELAVYVDGICRGAAVVEGNKVQINAYGINDTFFNGKEIEIYSYSQKRAIDQQKESYTAYNLKVGTYSSERANINCNSSYIKVKLNPKDNSTTSAIVMMINNYPNPFNQSTTISYNVVKDAKAKLEIYNVKGQLVRALVNEEDKSGTHSVIWDGKDNDKRSVASGVYFSKLMVDGKTQIKKMLLLK